MTGMLETILKKHPDYEKFVETEDGNTEIVVDNRELKMTLETGEREGLYPRFYGKNGVEVDVKDYSPTMMAVWREVAKILISEGVTSPIPGIVRRR
jgi:hypothetical protein